MTLPSNIQIVPCLESDAPELGDVSKDALGVEGLSRIYGALFSGDRSKAWTAMIKAAMEDTATNWFKAVEYAAGEDPQRPQQRIVAFTRYDIRSGSRDKQGLCPPGGPLKEADFDVKAQAAEILSEDAVAEQKQPGMTTANEEEKGDESQPGADPLGVRPYLGKIVEEFEASEEPLRQLYINTFMGRAHVYIKHLFVLHSHQRQGIGKALFSKSIEAADQLGVPAFLTASKPGYPMYIKAGFEQLGRFEAHLDYWAKRIKDREVEKGVWKEREARRKEQNSSLEELLSGSIDVQWCLIRHQRKTVKS